MKLTVLGVGLIGGSIGMAARTRASAEVTGHDPDPATLERALAEGAIDRAADSPAAACEGAEIVFCAAPVGALAGLAREALGAAGAETVVTDVGSTKRELVAAVGDDERFIGGHPLAGAETAGVENARADLFDGARWYLTPTERTGGVIYDRVQRALADLGARPQAIDPESHDRLMAAVSHLPHVLANLLVERAAKAAGDDGERLPETGPSFRDATRVAGANPAIWGDILSANGEAIAAEAEAVAGELERLAAKLRERDRPAVGAWHERAAERRRELLEAELEGGPLRELRVLVPNRPGIVAEIALALGRAGVNIEDMGLYPAADMRSGAITLYVAGDAEAERAAEIVRGLGHDVSAVER
jgi:prephenate dehydrogenase